MSASNPSRIPFEMMASGLPVVELYRENNLYDFPNDGCLLADSTPEAIANALLTILDDKKLQHAIIDIKNKFGKNSILKGMNLEEESTAIDRNKEVGGHKG